MKDLISIRKAKTEDAKKLSVLYSQVYIQAYAQEGISDEYANYIADHFSSAKFTDVIQTDPDCMLVAEYKNNLVGVLEMAWQQPCPIGDTVATEINKLYVLEWFCGKGIGTRLFCECENILRQKRMNELWLWALDTNTRAIRFYEKNKCRWIGDAYYQMETNTFVHKVMHKQIQD